MCLTHPTFRDARVRSMTLVFVVPCMLLSIVLSTMAGGCAHMERFRITNATGSAVTVTSGHTKKTVRIPDGDSVLVPHGTGNITITMPDGKTWVYQNLAPHNLEGTPFVTKTSYLFFGYEDGYFFRGSTTANLLLDKNSRLYGVHPNAKDVDVGKLEQPKGFPIVPDVGEGKEGEKGKR
jgi:hypothetical protein